FGGSLKGNGGASSLPLLQQRGLTPALSAANTWIVSGSAQALGDAVQMMTVFLGQIPNPANGGQPTNAVAITYNTPNGSLPADIWNSISDDTNLVKAAANID